MIITKKEQKDLINSITYIMESLSIIAEKATDSQTTSAIGEITDGIRVLLYRFNNAEMREQESIF